MKTTIQTHLSVRNGNGQPWIVKVVLEGEKYGLDNCLTNEGEPLVEFYDARQEPTRFDPEGQFVSRYYLSTLLERMPDFGIDLQGNVPSWKVDANAMAIVTAWLINNFVP